MVFQIDREIDAENNAIEAIWKSAPDADINEIYAIIDKG
jgi:hypothetical protein